MNIKDRLRATAVAVALCPSMESIHGETCDLAHDEIERLEREKDAIMQGQEILCEHIVNMREILGAEKGEDTIDACRRVVADLAKAREDVLAKCVAACEGEKAIYDRYPENEMYHQAVDDCIEAITRALKEKE